ncbi:MAG: 2-oxoacid:ferredoxin oxidoreductase subunit beta [Flavobacteriales bacterium]|nr:MAG: 2-oxoacid:ferredoxin oxidoreductase subunit beta [Flavobacteriales bacterium]
METETIQCLLKPKEYGSDQEVKWCPGCGDYAVLNAVKKTLSELNIPKEKATFISGIGCSSRFPYYMDCYGFHTIHGRAAGVATGTKIANPDLSVWMVSGDGDSLAIGGNHFIHAVRRNVDINLLLFNNEIYGLTKGQYSPTSEKGKVTKSSPHGTVEEPFNPGELALGSNSRFFARVPDTDVKMMVEVFKQAEQHKGFSVVEILQNCVIFNDKIHATLTAKETKADNQLFLKHGEPMLFGAENTKGIRLNGLELEVVTIGENGITEADILVHDAENENKTLQYMLTQMKLLEFPVAMGVIRNVKATTYDEALHNQRKHEMENSKFNSLDDLFLSGNTFKVK